MVPPLAPVTFAANSRRLINKILHNHQQLFSLHIYYISAASKASSSSAAVEVAAAASLRTFVH